MNGTTLACGCKHDERRWLVLCERHLLQWLDSRRIVGGEQLTAEAEPPGVSRDVLRARRRANLYASERRNQRLH